MKAFKSAGLIFYSIMALSVVATAIAHLWRTQSDLIEERRLGAAFRNAQNT